VAASELLLCALAVTAAQSTTSYPLYPYPVCAGWLYTPSREPSHTTTTSDPRARVVCRALIRTAFVYLFSLSLMSCLFERSPGLFGPWCSLPVSVFSLSPLSPQPAARALSATSEQAAGSLFVCSESTTNAEMADAG
jgi:hypothetical protein